MKVQNRLNNYKNKTTNNEKRGYKGTNRMTGVCKAMDQSVILIKKIKKREHLINKIRF
jgi:hypothetical protein